MEIKTTNRTKEIKTVMEEKTIRQDDEVEIDLLGLCLMLLHHLPLILSAAVLAALCAFLGTSLLLPHTYQSTTRGTS